MGAELAALRKRAAAAMRRRCGCRFWAS